MRALFYLGFVTILFASCEKSDSNLIVTSEENKDYFPLGIGNYWIYSHYEVDSSGNETERDRIDSITVSRDTVINNYQYFVLEQTRIKKSGSLGGVIDILRDSSGYIVNEKGEIRFSADNFTDILASEPGVFGDDTLYTLTYKMETFPDQVSVPAGDFEVLNYKGTVTTPQQTPGILNPRYINNLYSDNVGKVLETYLYVYSTGIIEKRLVRYYVSKE